MTKPIDIGRRPRTEDAVSAMRTFKRFVVIYLTIGVIFAIYSVAVGVKDTVPLGNLFAGIIVSIFLWPFTLVNFLFVIAFCVWPARNCI